MFYCFLFAREGPSTIVAADSEMGRVGKIPLVLEDFTQIASPLDNVLVCSLEYLHIEVWRSVGFVIRRIRGRKSDHVVVYPRVNQNTAFLLAFVVAIYAQRLYVDATNLNVEALAEDL